MPVRRRQSDHHHPVEQLPTFCQGLLSAFCRSDADSRVLWLADIMSTVNRFEGWGVGRGCRHSWIESWGETAAAEKQNKQTSEVPQSDFSEDVRTVGEVPVPVGASELPLVGG